MEGSKKYRTLRIIAFPEICTHNKMKQTDNVRGGLDQNNNYNNDKLAQWRSVCSGTFRKYGKTKPFLRSHSWQEKKSKKTKNKQTNWFVWIAFMNMIIYYWNVYEVWIVCRVYFYICCVSAKPNCSVWMGTWVVVSTAKIAGEQWQRSIGYRVQLAWHIQLNAYICLCCV